MEIILAKTGSLHDSEPAFQPSGTETNAAGGNLDLGLTQPLGFLSIDPVVSQPMSLPADYVSYAPIGGMFDVSQGLDWVCRIHFAEYNIH